MKLFMVSILSMASINDNTAGEETPCTLPDFDFMLAI
jgi:hypothetical protein